MPEFEEHLCEINDHEKKISDINTTLRKTREMSIRKCKTMTQMARSEKLDLNALLRDARVHLDTMLLHLDRLSHDAKQKKGPENAEERLLYIEELLLSYLDKRSDLNLEREEWKDETLRFMRNEFLHTTETSLLLLFKRHGHDLVASTQHVRTNGDKPGCVHADLCAKVQKMEERERVERGKARLLEKKAIEQKEQMIVNNAMKQVTDGRLQEIMQTVEAQPVFEQNSAMAEAANKLQEAKALEAQIKKEKAKSWCFGGCGRRTRKIKQMEGRVKVLLVQALEAKLRAEEDEEEQSSKCWPWYARSCDQDAGRKSVSTSDTAVSILQSVLGHDDQEATLSEDFAQRAESLKLKMKK